VSKKPGLSKYGQRTFVVPLYTFGEVNGLMYFVMGYVAGESLASRLRRDGPLSSEEARMLLADSECVPPSCGLRCTMRQIFACTAGVAVRGLLPLCCGSSPSIPASSKHCFQREMVLAVVCKRCLMLS
jgi:hypothetical protein